MSIINQMYGKIIKNSIENSLKAEISLSSVNNYLDFINYLDRFLLGIIKKSIINSFESIDNQFKYSTRRKELYYTKGLYQRTIMTLFGEITFEREYYVPKGCNTDGFFYVDELFSLPKRDYYDPMIKALIIEKSSEYSYIQSGKIIGDMIGSKFKSMAESFYSKISRQTVYNVIKNADMDYIVDEVKNDVDTIYIQFDEKYVYTQGTNKLKKEIKAAVIYTGIEEEYKNRNILVNRHIITSMGSSTDIKHKCLDYIFKTYDTNKINTVIISGDGAPWIKESTSDFYFHENITVHFVLDRFHMNQAINHITKDIDIKFYLRDYINNNSRKSFKELCDLLIIENPHRSEMIEKNRNYIINHWIPIQKQKHKLFLGCSMEGHISHVLAAPFSSRPKAHSLHMLDKRLEIIEIHVNKLDTKQIYLNNHVNPTIDSSIRDWDDSYQKSIFDTIGHKVTEKYKAFRSIINFDFLS